MIPARKIILQPVWSDRETYYAKTQDYGFGVELTCFAQTEVLNDKREYAQRLDAYRSELKDFPSEINFHGPFIDVLPHSLDHEVSDLARRRIYEALENAAELNSRHVIFHTGFNPLVNKPDYLDATVETQAKFWLQALENFPDLIICLENMWDRDPAFLKQILRHTSNDRLKASFDIGHWNVFSRIPYETWYDALENNLCYMHWNDNHGDWDRELPPGDGNIDWLYFTDEVNLMSSPPRIVIEVENMTKAETGLAYLSQFGFIDYS